MAAKQSEKSIWPENSLKPREQIITPLMQKAELVKLIASHYDIKDDDEILKNQGSKIKENSYTYTVISNKNPPQSTQIIPSIENYSKDYILKKIRGAIR